MHEPSVEDKWFVGEQYKRQVLEEMSPEQLIDVILCRPTVEMRPSFRDTGYTATYRFEPLTNMQFTRDQQITTRRGLVMAGGGGGGAKAARPRL